MVFYLFIFYSTMTGDHEDIATQFSANSFSTGLVYTLIVFISIMVVDRILYSKHAFISGHQASGKRQRSQEAASPSVTESKRTQKSQKPEASVDMNETLLSTE